MSMVLIESRLDQRILKHLDLKPTKKLTTDDWQQLLEVVKHPKHEITIAVTGKYI